ncbi:MAG: hypothetical protein GX267_14355 [Fibrobacter sp.]|nr:hypothetical protein [Fibrobacter sp.]
MQKNYITIEIKKFLVIVLIINLVTVTVGQEINLQDTDAGSEVNSSEELSQEDTSQSGNFLVDPDSEMGSLIDKESRTDDNRKYEQNYRQPSIGDRGVSAISGANSQLIDTIAKRKLLPPPVVLPDTTDNSQIDSSVVQPYKMGKVEKRILLITGAILATGGLVLLLVKSLDKGEKATEDVGFPDPPPPPEY